MDFQQDDNITHVETPSLKIVVRTTCLEYITLIWKET
jgi:hypothetical protein